MAKIKSARQPLRDIVKKEKNKNGLYVDILDCGHKHTRDISTRVSPQNQPGSCTRRRCTTCPPETKKTREEAKAKKVIAKGREAKSASPSKSRRRKPAGGGVRANGNGKPSSEAAVAATA